MTTRIRRHFRDIGILNPTIMFKLTTIGPSLFRYNVKSTFVELCYFSNRHAEHCGPYIERRVNGFIHSDVIDGVVQPATTAQRGMILSYVHCDLMHRGDIDGIHQPSNISDFGQSCDTGICWHLRGVETRSRVDGVRQPCMMWVWYKMDYQPYESFKS